MAIVVTPKERKIGIIAAVVFAVSVGIPSYGAQALQQLLNTESKLQSELQSEIAQLNEQLSSIEDERQKLRNNRADYLQWVNRGVVGAQQPIEWVKLLQRVQSSRYFQPVSYGFEGEELIGGGRSPLVGEGTIQISILRMNLAFPMLHDLDMLVLLEQIQKSTTSFFFPVDCAFVRTQAADAEFELVDRNNLNSECQIDWISVLDPAQDAAALAQAREELAAEQG